MKKNKNKQEFYRFNLHQEAFIYRKMWLVKFLLVFQN